MPGNQYRSLIHPVLIAQADCQNHPPAIKALLRIGYIFNCADFQSLAVKLTMGDLRLALTDLPYSQAFLQHRSAKFICLNNYMHRSGLMITM